MELFVEIADWFTINGSSFRGQVFATFKWALPAADAKIRLEMPVYDAIRSCIESRLHLVPPDVASTQRYELDRAAERLDRLQHTSEVFLNALMRYYGGRAAADGCVQLLRLGAAEVTGRLASFQTWDAAVRADVSSWYDIRDSFFSVCKGVFQGRQLVRVWIGRENQDKPWDIWLPQDYLPLESQYSTEVDDLTWVLFVLPQCGLQHVLGASHEIPWLTTNEVFCSRASRDASAIRGQRAVAEEAERQARTAKLCLNTISDPPTARVGPYIFPAPGMSGQFLERRTNSCLHDVVHAKPREWRAPSIWHAVLWLRDLAAWNQLGRPQQAPLTEAFSDSPPGAFLFRGQRNAQWPLRPSILRLSGEQRAGTAVAILRFTCANMHLQAQAEISPSLADAFIGAAQHYGLPTWYLDFSVDPLSAAFFASDNATKGDEAAIYWLSTETALRHGGKLILAPFWVERLYAQSGCFLDLSSLIESPDSADELSSDCYRIVFPASRELAESEYGGVGGRMYPESEWVQKAIEWARNSTTPPDDSPQLGAELVTCAGNPPWIAGSMFPQNHQRMFTFISRIVEWTALRLHDTNTARRRFSVDHRAMDVLFGQNPGVSQQFQQILGLINEAGITVEATQGVDVTHEPGLQSMLLWFRERQKPIPNT